MYFNTDITELISNNNFYFVGHTSLDSISTSKGYEIINHAYDLLNFNNGLYREDIISNLRKALNLRIKDLEKIIGFTKIKIPNNTIISKNKKLEKLESLGIVKPLLLNKLLFIRNKIEYEGEKAPNLTECNELIDVVWYFYKTTDYFCKFLPSDGEMDFEIQGVKYFLCLDFDFPQNEIIKLRGRLPDSFFSKDKKSNNFIKIYDFNCEDCTDIDIKYNNSKNYHKKHYSGYLKISELTNYFDICKIVLQRWIMY